MPVKELEPFIARYVKAVSACGVLTAGSCDGNQPGEDTLFLQLAGEPARVWHELICREFLKDRYNLAWDQSYTEIPFSEETRYTIYSELNQAAEDIYNSRMLLRQIKSNAMSGMTNGFLSRTDPQIIEEEFIHNVKLEFAAISS